MKPALAIFAFNRPASLARLLDSLSACPEFAEADVTVFVDAPRSVAESEAVTETLRVAHQAATANWRIVAAPENRGLRRSIYAGVSDVCARHGHAIVLEDDLVLAPSALTYFLKGLARYADEPRVWSICGYTYQHPQLMLQNRSICIPFAHPWGWATWKRAWDRFEFDQPTVPAATLRSRSFRHFFDVDGLSSASDLLDLAQKGLVDSWFIRWHQKIFSEGGVSVFPTRRYVTNIGVGKGGTHASALNPYKLLLGTDVPTNAEVGDWPATVEIDFAALDLMRQSWDARVQVVLARLGMVKRLVKLKRRGKLR
ncbi:glycosyltransferase [Brevundimonas nasdae]|uniref:Glycosyltransferase n=1 Tax=Brevundimonas nasdae TaxID=172043 RepID=A0ABX8TF59_9CAUL|nr:glycosyltransferase [Brevundimonas nasdae]QYC09816.1 glycosyltransferase [Brevundimonas nasdae]QYC12605.1 glycosyltransferase [Brevundimonas nasdae]